MRFISLVWLVLGLYIGAHFTMCFKSYGLFLKYEILVQVWNIMYYIDSILYRQVRDVGYWVMPNPFMRNEHDSST
jgi:hypothetical protein